jgi:hypothetical protein
MSVVVSQHRNFAGGEWVDSSRGERAARKRQFGTVWINDHTQIKHVMAKID